MRMPAITQSGPSEPARVTRSGTASKTYARIPADRMRRATACRTDESSAAM